EHALREENTGALGVFLEDVEDDLVFAHRAEILDAHLLGHGVELRHVHRLELGDVDRDGGLAIGPWGGSGFLFARFNGLGRHLEIPGSCDAAGLGGGLARARARPRSSSLWWPASVLALSSAFGRLRGTLGFCSFCRGRFSGRGSWRLAFHGKTILRPIGTGVSGAAGFSGRGSSGHKISLVQSFDEGEWGDWVERA